jgi:hypothetical protein
MQSEGFVFEQKPVFDWNHVPVGTVSTALRNPRTGATRQLVLRLSPEAQTELGTKDGTFEVPTSLVFGMRKDGLTLDRSLGELKKIDRSSRTLTSLLKK